MGHPIAWYNVGGGFGIAYRGAEAKEISEFAKVIVPVVLEMPIPVSPIADNVTSDRRPQLVVRNTAVSGTSNPLTVRIDL